jgi:hypothetical protein
MADRHACGHAGSATGTGASAYPSTTNQARRVIVVVGRAARRAAREPDVTRAFGPHAAAALDLLELTEFAWHDCYGDVTPPDPVVEDILVVASGDLGSLIRAARLAVEDSRDLRGSADRIRQDER